MERIRRSVALPTSAIVLNSSSTSANTLEFWSIRNGQLRDPRPFTENEAEAFVKAARKLTGKRNRNFSGKITKDILYLDGKRMIFRVRSQPHIIFLEAAKGVRKVKAVFPEMLFDYSGPNHRLSVYWKMPVKVNGKNNILPAPMPNVAGNGSVCLGTSMKDVRYAPEPLRMMELVKRTFFSSTFSEWRQQETHLFIRRCIDKAKDPELDLWDGKGRTGKALYKYAKERGITLNRIMERN